MLTIRSIPRDPAAAPRQAIIRLAPFHDGMPVVVGKNADVDCRNKQCCVVGSSGWLPHCVDRGRFGCALTLSEMILRRGEPISK